MSYTILSSPNRNVSQPEAGPYRDRLVRLQIAVGYVSDSVRRQAEHTVNGEVRLVSDSYKSQHPASAMAYNEVPTYNTTPVPDVTTARASVYKAHGDGRRPAEEVQAPNQVPSHDLTRQFLQHNPSVNTNNGYRPGESTHGSV